MNINEFENAKYQLQDAQLVEKEAYILLDSVYTRVLVMIGSNNLTDAPAKISAAITVTQMVWEMHLGRSLSNLTEDRTQVAKGKREDYTKGDTDVLKNFKNQAQYFGVDPKISLGVHMEKQMSAVLNYLKTDGESESEPIIKRVGDTLNYLELLWGLIVDDPDTDYKVKTLDVNLEAETVTVCEECGEPYKDGDQCFNQICPQ